MKQQSYHKFECENCGAPLTRTERRSEYRCDFCGAVYINEDHLAEEEVVARSQPITTGKPVTPVSIPDDSTPSFSPSPTTKPNKKMGQIIGILAFLFITCAVIAFWGRGDESRTENNQIYNNAVMLASTPEMVSSLPGGPIAVGNIIAYQGWELKVNRDVTAANGEINFSIALTNWTGEKANFRFKPGDIQLMDDAGNSYASDEGYCDRDQLFFEKEISFSDQQSRQIETSDNWCTNENGIPPFSGTIVSHATKLYVIFNNFGPFTKIIYEFDL